MSVGPSKLDEFLQEAEKVTSAQRVCVVTLFTSAGRVVEFGDPVGGSRSPGRSGQSAGGDTGGGRNRSREFVENLPTPDLLLEIPHGATREADYQALRDQLSPDLPEDLIDYFFVNTDVGAPEVAYRVAAQVAGHSVGHGTGYGTEHGTGHGTGYAAGHTAALSSGGIVSRSVLVLRCLIPRTFIDTNRVIDRSGLLKSEEKVLSAAFPDYIRTEADRDTLLSLYEQYHQIAERAHALVCGGGGLSIMPHSYAPRSIEIDTFDEGIGKALRHAYEPDLYKTWKTRPEVDFITQSGEVSESDPDADRPGKVAPMDLVDAVRRRYTALSVECAENESYSLHPASMAHHYSALHPGQTLCFEIRRDLLADPFSPFEEMTVSPSKVARMAGPIAESVVEFFERK